MKKINKKTAVASACVLGVLILAFTAYSMLDKGEKAASVIYREYKVQQMTQNRTMSFRGILKSSSNVPVVALTKGRITELVKQGTPVKKGDLLFRIDDTSARESIENQETALNSTELSLEQLRAKYDLVEFQEDNSVKQCKARLEHAILEENEELAKPDADERRLMEIEEKLAVLDLEDAQDAYDRELRMYKKQYITLSALEPYQRSLENAKAALEELRLSNQITMKGVTEERKVELRKAVERAQANLDRVGLRRARRLEDIKAQILAEEKSLDVTNSSIRHSQEEIDNATVYAPADGVFMLLTYRDWRSGGLIREINVGDERNLYDVIGHIINQTSMTVKMAVNEADFSALRLNMQVSVTFPAIPGQTFAGKITQLGAIGKERNRVDPTANGGGDSEVSMFTAAVDFQSEGFSFHPGMSAIVTAVTENTYSGIFLPRDAVMHIEDGGFAVMFKDGRLEKVNGRIFNDMYFLAESGVEPDNVILIPSVQQK